MEQYIEVFKRIYLPFKNKNLAESGLVYHFEDKEDVVYLSLNLKDENLSKQDILLLKHKIVTGFKVLHNKNCLCVIEADFKNDLNVKLPDVSGMFVDIKGVKKTIAVVSGKGGVGKTYCSLLLANKLKEGGFKVGVCDVDIYGASVSVALNIGTKHETNDGMIQPILHDGIYYASIGMLVEKDESIIWRGPMLSKAMKQLIRGVSWDVDFLVIDTPPGTGDVHINLMQQFPIDKVIAVTTNDDLSVSNSIKNIKMFHKNLKPIDRVYVNMAYLEKDGQKFDVFGKAGNAQEKMKGLSNEFIEIPFELKS